MEKKSLPLIFDDYRASKGTQAVICMSISDFAASIHYAC
jgi:hypothetical protein